MKHPLLLTTLGGFLLSSCGTMKSIGTSAGDGMARIGEGVGSGLDKVAEVASSPFRPGVPVVEAREDALKDLPSGEEKALAFQAEQRRRKSFWIFGDPIDFEEPSLPEDGGATTAGLLPPKVE